MGISGTPQATGANTALAARVALLENPPSCRVYHNTTQAVPDSNFTTVTFNSTRHDSANLHDPVTLNSRITIPTAGVYDIGFVGSLAARTDYLIIYGDLYLNGATIIDYYKQHPSNPANDNRLIKLGTQYKFAAGDYVQVRIYQDNTANASPNLEAISAYSPEFWATLIAAG